MRKITARIHNNSVGFGRFWPDAMECGEHPVTVRVSIPDWLADATTSGCCEVDTGVLLVGTNAGRKWGVAKYYSRWAQSDGTCEGVFYIAYDTDDDREREIFSEIEDKA